MNNWLKDYINNLLGDLIKLTKHKITNQYLRGLLFQLYENNGVIKRKDVDRVVKLIPAEERKNYRAWGSRLAGIIFIYLEC